MIRETKSSNRYNLVAIKKTTICWIKIDLINVGGRTLTSKVYDTGHLVGGNELGGKERDPGISALRRQRHRELLITRRPEHALPQASAFGLPHSAPQRLHHSRRRPAPPGGVGEELPDHGHEQIQLRPAPSPGEEGRAYLRPVHASTIDMVQHIVQHPQVHRHHLPVSKEEEEVKLPPKN